MELRPLLHVVIVAIEKGSLGLPSTKVANFTYLLSYIYFNCIVEITSFAFQILLLMAAWWRDWSSMKKKGRDQVKVLSRVLPQQSEARTSAYVPDWEGSHLTNLVSYGARYHALT